MSEKVYKRPCLDNIVISGGKEVGGAKRESESVSSDFLKRKLLMNRRRSYGISRGRRKCVKWMGQLEMDIKSLTAKDRMEDVDRLNNLRKSLSYTCARTLMRKFEDGNVFEYLGSVTSNHRLDPLYNREAAARYRKYLMGYFRKFSELKQEYDFMHLVLTVPHNGEGWEGQKFYLSEMLNRFNTLRKRKFWLDSVFAGIRTVEVTRGNNGLHIHFHCLILVRKAEQNRNRLFRDILVNWNELSIDSTKAAPVKSSEGYLLPSHRVDVIRQLVNREGNPHPLSETMLRKMDPRGSTMITLESIYYLKTRKGEKKKVYWNENFTEDEFRKALWECVKYHFEPLALEDDDENLDTTLALDIMRDAHKKQLLAKLGAFYKRRNKDNTYAMKFSEDPTSEELVEETIEGLEPQVLHPVTGRPVDRSEYELIVADPLTTYHAEERDYEIRISRKKYKVLAGMSEDEAFKYLYFNRSMLWQMCDEFMTDAMKYQELGSKGLSMESNYHMDIEIKNQVKSLFGARDYILKEVSRLSETFEEKSHTWYCIDETRPGSTVFQLSVLRRRNDEKALENADSAGVDRMVRIFGFIDGNRMQKFLEKHSSELSKMKCETFAYDIESRTVYRFYYVDGVLKLKEAPISYHLGISMMTIIPEAGLFNQPRERMKLKRREEVAPHLQDLFTRN